MMASASTALPQNHSIMDNVSPAKEIVSPAPIQAHAHLALMDTTLMMVNVSPTKFHAAKSKAVTSVSMMTNARHA